jgi:hypothetical protein
MQVHTCPTSDVLIVLINLCLFVLLFLQWSAMSGLAALDLSGNNLSGQLPIVWSNMTGMMSLDLSGNNFTVRCTAAY